MAEHLSGAHVKTIPAQRVASLLLVIGHTHQPNFAGILQRLADLPCADRIDESRF